MNEQILVQTLNFEAGLQILDMAKNQPEIEEIAKYANLEYPSPDLKIFKCEFLRVDEENRNGCTLPREEVEKSLNTLNGKAVDLEHIRSEVCGSWIKAEMEGDKVIAWGYIWPENFSFEAKQLIEDFDKGELHVSFEAWGRKIDKGNHSYEFVDLHFCGGALLRSGIEPAYNNAKVLEFAQAKYGQDVTLVTGTTIEQSKLWMEDLYTLNNMTQDIECTTCKEKGMFSIRSIDLDNFTMGVECIYCGAKGNFKFDASYQEKKKGKVYAYEEIKEGKIDSEKSKILKQAKNQEEIDLLESNSKKGDKSMDEIREKEYADAKELVVTLQTRIEKLEEEKATVTEEKSTVEGEKTEAETKLQALTEEKAAVEQERDELKAKLEGYEAIEAEKAAKVKEDMIKARREELKDYLETLTDEVSDEDVANDDKYELFKAKAEVETLKKNPKVIAALDLEVSGAKEKETPEWKKDQEAIDSVAYPKVKK